MSECVFKCKCAPVFVFFLCFLGNFFVANEVTNQIVENYIKFVWYSVWFHFFFTVSRSVVRRKDECAAYYNIPHALLLFSFSMRLSVCVCELVNEHL